MENYLQHIYLAYFCKLEYVKKMQTHEFTKYLMCVITPYTVPNQTYKNKNRAVIYTLFCRYEKASL